MGEILAFSPRPPASDWSANERGLLMLLTQQLAASYGEVDGIFGQTDSGDPWYVVTDANQDVLVHIARIDGQFVVHDAAVDMFHQVGSLWGALRHVLAQGAPQEQGSVVVAFNPSSREAQSFLSLVIAVGLYLELRGVDLGEAGRLNFDGLPRADDPAIEGVASKLIAALNLEADRAQAQAHALPAAAVAQGDAAPLKPEGGKTVVVEPPSEAPQGLAVTKVAHLASAPAPSAPSGSAPEAEGKQGGGDLSGQGFAGAKYVMLGTPGDDVLFGSPGADTIRGGAGADYIDGGGAGAGQVDRLDGGEGADRIVMNARVVASGGAGADTFLFSTQQTAGKAEALLGVVLDYSAAAGDRLAVAGKGHVTVVSTANVADVLAAQGTALGEASTGPLVEITHAVAGARIGFDLDGDGREDVFILLGGAGASTFRVGTTIANDYAPTPEVPLVGQPAADAGHYGDPTTPAH